MKHLPLLLLLAGCAAPLSVDGFAGTGPAFDSVRFWTGHRTSWGVLEDRSGQPTRIVTTDCVGEAEGPDGVHMVQTLHVGDEAPTTRDWHMRRLGGGRFAATASDMAGEAEGEAAGRVFHWRWDWNTGRVGALTMDQWMYAQLGGAMVNRTTIRKLGVIVAEVTETFAG